LHGRPPEQRRGFRQRVLAVSLDDLKRVGETWLIPEQASIAVVGDADTLEREGAALGLRIEEL
jgi:predicted Zn-dependent peptidase